MSYSITPGSLSNAAYYNNKIIIVIIIIINDDDDNNNHSVYHLSLLFERDHVQKKHSCGAVVKRGTTAILWWCV